MKFDYGDFTKLDCYLLNLKSSGEASIIFKEDEPWFNWGDYYFFKGLSGNFIRKGSLKDIDTIYIGGSSRDSVWLKNPDIKLLELFKEADIYWKDNIDKRNVL
jgi:hypothetical protein